MEDNQFWDELAKRLRQEPAQNFREEDWATVHQRIQVKGKRRAVWFWPLIGGLVLMGNNLIWYLLLPQLTASSTMDSTVLHTDTVILIRERVVHDTLWQQISAQPNLPAEQLPLWRQHKTTAQIQPIINKTPAPEALPPIGRRTAADRPEKMASVRVPNTPLRPLLSEHLAVMAPFTASIIPARSNYPIVARRTTSLLIAADGGGGTFMSEKLSRMHLQEAGASLYIMPGKWGITTGLFKLHAKENPPAAGPGLGWPVECATCPGPSDFPDKVSVQWTSFHMGLAYRVALPNRKTELLLSVAGQLRGPVEQYRHFRFEDYGSTPILVDDRYRQESGLYWNGWSSRMSIVHRISGHLGVSGSVHGRWPGGVTPKLVPASIGLNAGLVWYVWH